MTRTQIHLLTLFYFVALALPSAAFAHHPELVVPCGAVLSPTTTAVAANGEKPAIELLGSGMHHRLGAHLVEGVGTTFAVYAPNAKQVIVVLNRDGGIESVPLKRLSNGIWTASAVKAPQGTPYLYHLEGADLQWRIRTDPVGVYTRLREKGEFTSLSGKWTSVVWKIKPRKNRKPVPPGDRMLSFQIHPGSMFPGEPNINMRILAERALPELLALGITHVTFTPLTQYPDRETWGYLHGNPFSIDSFHGSPDDYVDMVDLFADHGIAVVWDVVYGHATNKEETGFVSFDGTHLFLHEEWGTNTGYGSYYQKLADPFVRDFYLSNADFWVDVFGMGALRVDAVDLFVGHPDPWQPQTMRPGGWEFLRAMNAMLEERYPHVLRIAEDTKGTPRILDSLASGGLGFHLMWATGFEHELMEYLRNPLGHRNLAHFLFSGGGKQQGNFIISGQTHDGLADKENPKHSKWGRPLFATPDDLQADRQGQFDFSRAMYGWIYTGVRGNPMIFMGTQWANVFPPSPSGRPDRAGWDWNRPLQTIQSQALDRRHAMHKKFFQVLGKFYRTERAFARRDDGASVVLNVNGENHTQVTARYGTNASDTVLVVSNFSPTSFPKYWIPVPHVCPRNAKWEVVLDTSEQRFGSSQSRPAPVALPIQEHPAYGSAIEIDQLLGRTTIWLKCIDP